MKTLAEQIFGFSRLRMVGAFALVGLVAFSGWPVCAFGDASSGKRTFYKFLNSKGNIIITNRPDKYRRKSGLVELGVKLAPINILNAYRKGSVRSKADVEKEISLLIARYALQYGVDENLIYAMIAQESGFRTDAISKAGACGLMQLMPETAAEMNIPRARIFDPAYNIPGGVQYISKLIQLFEGDLRLALAAYNAGASNVKRYRGIPPFKETRAYVENVLILALDFSKRGDAEKRNAVRGAGKTYIVFFHSGRSQRANSVIDKDPYYQIDYKVGRKLIRKELVRKVVGPI